MQIGIDSFAAAYDETSRAVARQSGCATWSNRSSTRTRSGLDVFGIGEHHRQEFLDSAPAVILGAAAARTQSHSV